jgi:hypothetical protein
LDLLHLIHSQLGTTCNYSASADLHTVQFTVTHVLEFSVFTSRILATDLHQSHCHFKSHVNSSSHSLVPFLSYCATANSVQLQAPKLLSRRAGVSSLGSVLNSITTLYSAEHFARNTQKTASVIKEACLLIRYLAVDVLLLHAFASAGKCLPSRCF